MAMRDSLKNKSVLTYCFADGDGYGNGDGNGEFEAEDDLSRANLFGANLSGAIGYQREAK